MDAPQQYNRVGDEKDAAIRRLLVTNMTFSDIAKETGAAPKTVSRIAKEMRIDPPHVRLAKNNRRKIEPLLKQGMTCRAVAGKVGVSIGVVSNIARAIGVKPHFERMDDETREQVLRLLKEGMDGPTIADAVGCSCTTVYRIRDKAAGKKRKEQRTQPPQTESATDRKPREADTRKARGTDSRVFEGRVKTLNEVPAQYRDGGTMKGNPLIPEYLAIREKFNLPGHVLSRSFGPGKALTKRLKVSRVYVYEYRECCCLRDRREHAAATREGEPSS